MRSISSSFSFADVDNEEVKKVRIEACKRFIERLVNSSKVEVAYLMMGHDENWEEYFATGKLYLLEALGLIKIGPTMIEKQENPKAHSKIAEVCVSVEILDKSFFEKLLSSNKV